MSGLVAYVASAIISAFRPALFKHYKDYMLFTLIVSIFSMWLGSAAYLYYEGGAKMVEEGIKDSLKWENIKLSWLSETRFISKMTSLLFLPISVAVPLSELWIVSAAVFDNIINKVSYDATKIISIILLIGSGTLIGWGDYKSDKGAGRMQYIIGGMLMLISVILSGYMLITFQNIDIEEGPGKTMMIESTGSLLLLAPLLLFVTWPSWWLIFILLLGTTLVFNIDIILKFIGLRQITTYQAITFGAISTVVGTILGPILFNESITLMKTVGLVVLIGTVIYNGWKQ